MRRYILLFVAVAMGSFLASLPGAETARAAAAYREVPQISHADAIQTIAVSAKFPIIATGGHEAKIFIWHRKQLKLLRVLEGHKDWIDDLQFLPDGKRLISRAKDGTVRIWDTETGKELHRFGGKVKASLQKFTLAPDGSYIIFKPTFSKLEILSLQAPADKPKRAQQEIGSCGYPGIGQLFCRLEFVFSRDSQSVFVAQGRDLVQLAVPALKPLFSIRLADSLFQTEGPYARTETVIWDILTLTYQQHDYIALAFRDGRVQLRRAENGALIWETNLIANKNAKTRGILAQLVHAAGGKSLHVLTQEKWLKLDLADGTVTAPAHLNAVATGAIAAINTEEFAIAGKPFASSQLPASDLAIIKPQNGTLQRARSARATTVKSVAGASKAPIIATGSYSLGAVRLFNIEKKTLISEHRIPGIKPSRTSLSGNGRYVAVNGMGRPGAVWDSQTGQLVRILGETSYTHYTIQISDNGKTVMYPTKSDNFLIVIQDIQNDNAIKRIQELGSKANYTMPVLSPDSKRVAFGSDSHGVHIYDLKAEKIIKQIKLGGLVWTLATSPKAAIFASADHGGQVVIADWDGKERARFKPAQPHYPNQQVRSMDISNDGESVIAGDEDGRVCLLSVKDKKRNCFLKIATPVDSVSFAGNDRYIVLADRATSTFVIDRASLKPIMTIEQSETGSVIKDLRDNSLTKLGTQECIEVSGYDWRSCGP